MHGCGNMREVQASEAEGKIAELLGAVERGENIVICRNSRRDARLVPDPERRR